VLPQIKATTDKAEVIANLVLNTAKTFLIPFGGADFEHAALALKSWVFTFLADWRGIAVVDKAPYLGVWLGYNAQFERWREAVGKWYARDLALGRSGSSTFFANYSDKRRALPVPGSLAQFAPPPPGLNKLDLYPGSLGFILYACKAQPLFG